MGTQARAGHVDPLVERELVRRVFDLGFAVLGAQSDQAGEQLDEGTAALVVVGASDMASKIERAMARAEAVETKQIEADQDAIEADARES